MHVSAPQPRFDGLPIFFNIDSSVGANAQNSNFADITLVQFLIRKSAERDAGTITLDRRARMLKVVPDGRVGPLTIDGIRAVQETMRDKNPATVVDGRVSPARGYRYGAGVFTIVSINTANRTRYPEFWPCLHHFPGCPAILKMESAKSL
ncbi:MAG: hypothetical protein P8Y71_30000 [Pseudolabrys sp.]